MSEEFKISKYSQDKNPNSHIHEEFEILISLNNEGKFFVRKHGYALRFGMVFILPPFEIHRCFCEGNQDYERCIIHFHLKALQRMSTKKTDLAELFSSGPIVCQARDDVLSQILADIPYLLKEDGERFGDDIERNLRFESLLLRIARIVQGCGIPTIAAIENDWRIEEILEYIHQHYEESITLDSVAQKFFMSKSRLSQIFKNATGFSLGDYIIMYRIKRACTLLQSGEQVQDVAAAVGFKNSTHFIRTFKARIGCSPKKFTQSIVREQMAAEEQPFRALEDEI